MVSANSWDRDDTFIKGKTGTDAAGDPTGEKITSSTDGFKQRLDVSTQEIQIVIDLPEDRLNKGQYFTFTDIFTLNANQSRYYAFEVGSGDDSPHLSWNLAGLEDIEFYIYEAPTYTQGAAQTYYNSNRNYSSVSSNTSFYLASAVSGGTTIYQEYIPTKSGRPEGSDNRAEFILARNTNYIIEIKSLGNNNRMFFHAFGYESEEGSNL